MIVVKIELWPLGNKNEAKILEEVHIANIGKGEQVRCPYKVTETTTGQNHQVLHSRAEGFYKLVQLAFTAIRAKNRKDHVIR